LSGSGQLLLEATERSCTVIAHASDEAEYRKRKTGEERRLFYRARVVSLGMLESPSKIFASTCGGSLVSAAQESISGTW
jgi:hypothetical protein